MAIANLPSRGTAPHIIHNQPLASLTGQDECTSHTSARSGDSEPPISTATQGNPRQPKADEGNGDGDDDGNVDGDGDASTSFNKFTYYYVLLLLLRHAHKQPASFDVFLQGE